MSPRVPTQSLLTAEDEQVLARRIEAGVLAGEVLASGRHSGATASELLLVQDEGRRAWERFLLANVKLVQLIANREALRSGHSAEELFQEGFLGLLQALQRWDHRRGTRFSTFAVYWIRDRVIDAAATGLGSVPACGKTVRKVRQLNAVEARLVQERGRTVSRDEVWAVAGQRLAVQRLGVLTPPAPLGDHDPGFWPGGPEAPLVERLHDQLAELAPDERTVIALRYGFATGEPLTQAEVARRLGVGLNTVRRREQRALALLRDDQRGHAVVA